jgi:hypothetical protein
LQINRRKTQLKIIGLPIAALKLIFQPLQPLKKIFWNKKKRLATFFLLKSNKSQSLMIMELKKETMNTCDY